MDIEILLDVADLQWSTGSAPAGQLRLRTGLSRNAFYSRIESLIKANHVVRFRRGHYAINPHGGFITLTKLVSRAVINREEVEVKL